MAALTDNLSAPETLERNGLKSKWTILNADKLYAGAILAVDYTDEIQNATNTAGLRVIGRCPEYVDNTNDGETVSPEQGIFRYANSGTYTIPRSSIGLPCYVKTTRRLAATPATWCPPAWCSTLTPMASGWTCARPRCGWPGC